MKPKCKRLRNQQYNNRRLNSSTVQKPHPANNPEKNYGTQLQHKFSSYLKNETENIGVKKYNIVGRADWGRMIGKPIAINRLLLSVNWKKVLK